MDFLSEKDQFRDVLNDEEISRIKDNELRKIRFKYWNLNRKIFLDEVNYSDQKFCEESTRLYLEEKQILEKYKKEHYPNL